MRNFLRASVVILAISAFVLPLAVEAAPSCKGNACKDVEFRFSDGCHKAKNVGTQRVRASIGALSVYLYPGDEKPFRNLDGKCLTMIVGGKKAKYVK